MSNYRHGHARVGKATIEYRTYIAMMNRCYCPSDTSFDRYNGRGITVCAQWKNNFPQFLSDMGKKPKGMTLERKNNNEGYSKENCIWADALTQSNNRRNNHFLNFGGKSQTIMQWSRELGINRRTLGNRIANGWPVAKALTQPSRPMNKHNTRIET